VEGFCEHGNELLASMKCMEILEWLRKWRVRKKRPAPWSPLVSYILSLFMYLHRLFRIRIWVEFEISRMYALQDMKLFDVHVYVLWSR
jgi:hypothetical protein